MTFRIRENTRDISGAPGYNGFKGYWVYCSPEFTDYYEALKYAIALEKKGCYKNWVECIMDCDDYDFNPDTKQYETLTNQGFISVTH